MTTGRVRLLASAAIAAALLAGCSSQPAPPESVSQFAQRIGCSGYQDGGAAPGATGYGTCTFSGTEVQLYTFTNPQALSTFMTAMSQFASKDSAAIHGSEMAYPQDTSVLDALRKAVSG